jgi:hypothetical protein
MTIELFATTLIEKGKHHQNRFYKSFLYLLIFCTSIFASNPAKAQVNVSLNISSQALWGPVGYDHVEYYYLPEVDAFYYVPTGEFIYWNGNTQVNVYSLPVSFRVNLYNTYKVVVNSPRPYLQHKMYQSKYGKYKHGGPKQKNIRDSDDARYYSVKGHPKHGGGNNKGYKNNNNPKGQKNAQKQYSAPKQQMQPSKNGGSNGGGKGGGKKKGN